LQRETSVLVRTYVSTCRRRLEGREAADDRRDEVVCFASVQKGVAGDDRLCGSSHVRRPPLRGGEYGW